MMKQMISLTTCFVFLLSSVASAGDYTYKPSQGTYTQTFNKSSHAGDLSESEKERLKKDKELLEKMGYRISVDMTNKKTTVYTKDSSNAVMEFPFADEGTLRKFSPKSLNTLILNEMRKVNTANKEAFSHSLKNLPAESAIFFMAMGAVVAGQLITNYSQNPVAMKQHVEHSLSPIGVFGFYTFMYSQGVTSNVLAMYMTNPKFHHMIPYLGMTVGAFVQGYLTQIASDPNVMACAKVMMGGTVSDKALQAGVDKDPCSKAYDYLVLQKKLWEFAPGIVSMLASSAIAGIGQAVITKTVLRITGFDIATLLLPGKMEVKGIRLLLVKGLQIAAFVAIDQWLNSKVNYAWKNIFDGRELGKISDNLEADVNALKKSNWQGNDSSLQANMKLFREKMSAWRMVNLSNVYEAHQSWSEALNQLTGMYNASYVFYNDFVEQVRGERFGDSGVKPLQRISPLYGVVAKGVTADRKDLYLLKPIWIENMQLLTVQELAPKAKALLAADTFKYLTGKEKATFTEVVQLLQSTDKMVLGKAFAKLNAAIAKGAELSAPSTLMIANTTSSRYYLPMLNQLRSMYGNPIPMVEKGRGWVNAYADTPTTSEKVNNVPYYRKVGIFSTPKVTDYFVMQMACGPDVERGEKAIKQALGYPSVFLPPTLRYEGDHFDVCHWFKEQSFLQSLVNGSQTMSPAEDIYKSPVKSAKGQYDGFVSYLLNQLRPSALGNANESNFDKWWKRNTEAQMQAAFVEYGKQYDKIVAKMIQGIYRQGRSSLNAGPAYNGTMNAAFQEQRVYLSLLAELIKPTQKYDMNLENNLQGSIALPLLRNVEAQFAVLNGLIRKIKVVTKEGREQIESPLENYQLEEQLQAIQIALGKVSEALGVGEGAQNMKLKPAQRNMAVSALENLQGIAAEIMMYGSMANAVSWDKIRNVKQVNMEQSQFENEVQQKLAQLRGMTSLVNTNVSF